MKARLLIPSLCLLWASTAIAHGNLANVVASGDRSHALDMISEGSDVNAQQSDGTTALLYAAHQGDLPLVSALLQAGADVSHSNAYGTSPIAEAAQLGSVEILETLLNNGADANWTNPEGETPLLVVARAGNLPAAKLLLEHGADIHAKESWGGQNAIMWATAQRQPEMMSLLIANGADVDEHGVGRIWNRRITSEPRPKDMNKGGFTPLLYAAREGCIECVNILVEAGADLDATDPDGVTALNLALINLHFDTAAALIEAGANVNKWDIFGRGPLFNAIDLNTIPVGGRPDIPSADSHSAYDIAVMLLDRGANPNMQLKLRPPYRNAVFDRGADNVLSTGATPLLRAARAADNESLALLLEHGALADLPNAQGQTPLMVVAGVEYPSSPTRGHYKTQNDSVETLRLLLEAGADINSMTGNPRVRPDTNVQEANRNEPMQPAMLGIATTGRTALHGAAKQGWTQIAEFLVENGAVQEISDSSGKTPFDLAMGRYEPAFLDTPPVPLVETAVRLQEMCQADDNCVMEDTIDFSNPNAIK